VEPHLLELSADPNETVTSALAFLRRSGRAASGDKLVIATDIVAEDRRVDSVQLRTLA
jgi:pyruvate kinase